MHTTLLAWITQRVHYVRTIAATKINVMHTSIVFTLQIMYMYSDSE